MFYSIYSRFAAHNGPRRYLLRNPVVRMGSLSHLVPLFVYVGLMLGLSGATLRHLRQVKVVKKKKSPSHKQILLDRYFGMSGYADPT